MRIKKPAKIGRECGRAPDGYCGLLFDLVVAEDGQLDFLDALEARQLEYEFVDNIVVHLITTFLTRCDYSERTLFLLRSKKEH